jgi:hypothetical protein
MDCEQPGGAASRVFGGGHAQIRGGFIDTVLWPRGKGSRRIRREIRGDHPERAVFVQESLAEMTCGATLSASEEKEEKRFREGLRDGPWAAFGCGLDFVPAAILLFSYFLFFFYSVFF